MVEGGIPEAICCYVSYSSPDSDPSGFVSLLTELVLIPTTSLEVVTWNCSDNGEGRAFSWCWCYHDAP